MFPPECVTTTNGVALSERLNLSAVILFAFECGNNVDYAAGCLQKNTAQATILAKAMVLNSV